MPYGTAPQNYTTPTGNYSGGGVTAGRTTASAPAPTAPRTTTSSVVNARKKKKSGGGGLPLQKWLRTDPTYRNTINDLVQNFQTYKIGNYANRDDLLEDFDVTKQRLGQEETKANKSQVEDYAARGLYGSGVFQREATDLGLKYGEQKGDAQTSYDRNLLGLQSDLTNAETLRRQQAKDARLNAVRRYSERFGITR